VSVYVLLNTDALLDRFLGDIQAAGPKLPFNKINLAFARPTMDRYVSGSLAYTGIAGYYEQGSGQGVEAFKKLKKIVALLKAKNVEVYLSLGGWDYSCNYPLYLDKCGPAPSPDGEQYDYFLDVRTEVPDPTEGPSKGQLIPNPDLAQAQKSYDNALKLAIDLGVQGIDVDYEEFWHADKFAILWRANPYAGDIFENILNAQGGITYSNLIKYGTAPT
jgi:chitinase